MACTKTNHDCTCTLADAHHPGRHKCGCGQEWLGKQATRPEEHAVLMELRATTEAAGEEIDAALAEHETICSLLRSCFGLTHQGAHMVMHSYRMSMEKTAEYHGVPLPEYMDGLPEPVKMLHLGAVAGAFMAEAGEVHHYTEGDGDE